jgi:hypothetical protein
MRTWFKVVLLLLLTLPAVVEAQFTFTTNKGTITITGYTGPGGTVIIPEAMNGLPVTTIGPEAFYQCWQMISVTIPDSVTNISDGAFEYCKSLYSVTIPNSVTSIGGDAFAACLGLISLTIGTNVNTIGIAAFEDCSNLIDVTIPNSVTNIRYEAFDSCTSLRSVTLPDSITTINANTFNSCSSLTNVTIPSKVTSLDGFMFCTGLRSITIPASVTNIASYAFEFDTGLTSVTIGTNVVAIGANAFSDSGLTNVMIPSSVSSIGDGAFSWCFNLTNIAVEALNSAYISVDGVLFNKSLTTLVQYPAGKRDSSYRIPSGVSIIGNYSFFNDSNLTAVTVPCSVIIIGEGAFDRCNTLTGLYFSGNPPALNPYPVFYNDSAVVYYLPRTVGWGTLFGGLQTMLWNPQAQAAGVRTNRFGFNIAGTTRIPIVVEASTNLPSTRWTSLQSCTLTNGSIYFSDPQWTNYPSRCYRIRSP